jgi:hypothetical protein
MQEFLQQENGVLGPPGFRKPCWLATGFFDSGI